MEGAVLQEELDAVPCRRETALAGEWQPGPDNSSLQGPRREGPSAAAKRPEGPPAVDTPTITEEKVFRDELDAVHLRRVNVCGDKEWKAGPDKSSLKGLRREALNNDLVGLAFSGGGIRSATFCLGFLQGLSHLGLLRCFDYLSTVSGGGYIGGWLAAWIKREGNIGNVEKQLRPSRIDQAQATRAVPTPGTVLDDEPEPIRHLRAYSNYLAPRPSLFSADGWVLIALYLRNTLLNQLVLLLALTACLFGVVLSVKVFSVSDAIAPRATLAANTWSLLAQATSSQGIGFSPGGHLVGVAESVLMPPLPTAQSLWQTRWIVGICAIVALVCLVVSGARIYGSVVRARHGGSGEDLRMAHRHFWQRVLLPLGAVAIAISIGSMAIHPWLFDQFDWAWFWWSFAFFALLHVFFNIGPWRWIVAGALAGATGGALAYLGLWGLHQSADAYRAVLVVALGPPLVLVIYVVTTFVQIGLLGREIRDEARREWWASLAGWLLGMAAVWAFVFGTILFGQAVFVSGLGTEWAGQAIMGITWAVTVLGGLFAAHSSRTGQNQDETVTSSLLDLLARIAPAVFLIGVVVLVAIGIQTVIDFHEGAPPGATGTPWDKAGAYLARLARVDHWWYWVVPLVGAAGGAALAFLLGYCVDINLFSLSGVYANRLIRCYLGASRPKASTSLDRKAGAPTNSEGPDRAPNDLTGFDPHDDLGVHHLKIGLAGTSPGPLAQAYWGPLHLINMALNVVKGDELAWQERKAEPFVVTPYACGNPLVGYRPTEHYAGGVTLGRAVAISGAAVSPNMGYHSSVAVTALLTVFNARLGAWVGNPKRSTWARGGPYWGLLTLLQELAGQTGDEDRYVYLSDGGHFEDLGVYELIRRRCRFIVVCDAGADPAFDLEDLGNMIRKVRIDFGARIVLDVSGLRRAATGRSTAHVAVGKVLYGDTDKERAAGAKRERQDEWSPRFAPEKDEGILIYVKSSLTGDEPADLENYVVQHPSFPNDPTTNQFFTESQFESYRALGFHCASEVFSSAAGPTVVPADDQPWPAATKGTLFKRVYDRWFPSPPDYTRAYLESNNEYAAIHEALDADPRFRWLRSEIYPDAQDSKNLLQDQNARSDEVRGAERHLVVRMLTVLENAWFGLNLARYLPHPVNNGWKVVYDRWFGAKAVRDNWDRLKPEFSQEFQDAVDRHWPPPATP
jgi:hypothetical protein